MIDKIKEYYVIGEDGQRKKVSTPSFRIVQEKIGAKHDEIMAAWGFETELMARLMWIEIETKDRGVWPYKYRYALETHDGAGGWVQFEAVTSNYSHSGQE